MPTTAEATRVVVRPLANPLSLGFLGVFFSTVLVSAIQLSWVPLDQEHDLAIGILVFTVPLQLISCVYGFLTRDMVAATGLGVQAGVWGAVGATLLLGKEGSHSPGLAMMLVTGAVALCMPVIGALPGKLLAGGVMFTTAVRWGVTAGYEWSGGEHWKLAAGAAGLLLALASLYASLAYELEDQRRRTVLPTFRHGSAVEAMEGDLADQVQRAANEAGVRAHL